MAFCTACGVKIGDDSRFCRKCGQEIIPEEKGVQVEETVAPLVQTGTKPPLISIILATVGMALEVSSFWSAFTNLLYGFYDMDEIIHILLPLIAAAGYVFIVLGMCQYDKQKKVFIGIGALILSFYTLIHMSWYIGEYEFTFAMFMELLMIGVYVLCGVGFLTGGKIGNILKKIGGLSLIAGSGTTAFVEFIWQVVEYDFEFRYVSILSLWNYIPILLGVAILLYPSKQEA